MKMRKLFVFLMIFSFSGGFLKSQPVISETMDYLDFRGKSYSIHITRSPFGIVVNNYKNDIIEITGIIHETTVKGKLYTIKAHNITTERIDLSVADENSRYFSVVIFTQNNGLKISLSSSDKSVCKKIGFRFDTKISGHWYGGAVVKSHLWPLETNKLTVDPFYATSNQTSPVWYTSAGAGIFAETFSNLGYSFNDPVEGVFELYSKDDKRLDLEIIAGVDIRDAFNKLSEILGKPFVVPPSDYFVFPQFNTWIEFMSNVNQEGITRYVEEIRKNNFPSRLFIIDDKWTKKYGDPEFDLTKFPDPGKMISFLHEYNFKIALWITPFIEAEAKNFKYASDHNFLIMDPGQNKPYFTEWWNGTAAMVDLSNPEAYSWFLGLLENLRDKYGVDGFKLDAGDAEYLDKPFSSYGSITTNEYTDLFAGLGKYFEANELRVSWRTQSLGLIQRLRDKAPTWSAIDGLNSLIPHALTSSLLGYVFVCPDMIGGGLDSGFKTKGYKFDEELFVRWTEASALMPMMQFSVAPWRLKKENIAICRKYSDLHVSLGDYIYSLAEKAKIDGSPIVRPLFFEFPSDETAFHIHDEFMLGERFLVAPVLQQGAVSRKVYLPESTWIDFWTGKIFHGGQSIEYPAPLEILPVFIRVE